MKITLPEVQNGLGLIVLEPETEAEKKQLEEIIRSKLHNGNTAANYIIDGSFVQLEYLHITAVLKKSSGSTLDEVLQQNG